MARDKKKWLVRLAALGALAAWIFNRKKQRQPAPEGIWQDVTPKQ